jgi:hypothetical protein
MLRSSRGVATSRLGGSGRALCLSRQRREPSVGRVDELRRKARPDIMSGIDEVPRREARRRLPVGKRPSGVEQTSPTQ